MAEMNPSTAPAEAAEDQADLTDEDQQSEPALDDSDRDEDGDGGNEDPLIEPCTFESQIYNDQKTTEPVLSSMNVDDQKTHITKLLTNQKDNVTAPRGIQSLYNSSSSDCVLYSMFAFNTTFDYLFDPIPGLPCEHNSPMRILTRQIVTPLRKIGFVGAKRIVALKLALQRVGRLRSRTVVEKRPADKFLDDLLKSGLRVQPQLKLHAADVRTQPAISMANSISVPVIYKEDEDYVTSSSLIEKWTLDAAKKFDSPLKNLVVNLNRRGGPFDEPVVVLPLITISLTHCLHGVKRICTACVANKEKAATVECVNCFDSDPSHKKLSECTFCDSCYSSFHNRESERGGHRSNPIAQQNSSNNHAAKDGASLHEGDISHPYELYAVICENVTNHVVYACTDMDAEQIKEAINDYLAPVESNRTPEQAAASTDETTKLKNPATLAPVQSSDSAGSSYESVTEKEKKDSRLWVYYDPEAIVKEDVRGGYNVPQVYAVDDFHGLINHKTLDKTHDLVDAFAERINSHHQYRVLCESVALFYRPVLSQKSGQ